MQQTHWIQLCAAAGVVAFCAVTYVAITSSQKLSDLPIEEFRQTAQNSLVVSEQAKGLIETNAQTVAEILTKANASLDVMTRQVARMEKLNRFSGGAPAEDGSNDSYLDFAVRMREQLDQRFAGQGYRVSLQRKLASKPQSELDEYESYEVWIGQRTGGTTSAQMAAGIINDAKTVLTKLTVSPFPRPGFDNRYVIWRPDDVEKTIVDISEGQTEADGPIFVLDWLALQDDEARQYAVEIVREQ